MSFDMVKNLLVCGADKNAESSNDLDARSGMIKFSGKCNICKKVGHMAKNCFQKKDPKSSTPTGVVSQLWEDRPHCIKLLEEQ